MAEIGALFLSKSARHWRVTHMPNKAPPKWAAWSKKRHPRIKPAASKATMALSACWQEKIMRMRPSLLRNKTLALTHTDSHFRQWRCTLGGRWWPVWLQAFWCKQPLGRSWWPLTDTTQHNNLFMTFICWWIPEMFNLKTHSPPPVMDQTDPSLFYSRNWQT